MSSLAQEESRSTSENVQWGKRKQFADGKVSLPYKRFLGYEKGPDGLPHVVEEQAKTVRQIYRLFLEGKAYGKVAAILTDQGIPSPGGKTTWSASTVESILKKREILRFGAPSENSDGGFPYKEKENQRRRATAVFR